MENNIINLSKHDKNETIWPNRLYALDVSRAIAALSVVLWHWQHFAYDGGVLSNGFIFSEQPLYGILKIFYEKGRMGVAYFFLLSGFIFFWIYSDIIKNKKIDGKSFFIQRFSRLYPLHFVTLIAVAVLQYFYIQYNDNFFVYVFNDAYHFFLNLGFATEWGFEKGTSFNAPVWSVSVEVLLYLIFFFFVFFERAGMLFCFVVAVAATFIYHMVFVGMSLFFFGGVVFYFTKLVSTKYKALKLPIYLLTVIIWFCVITSFYIYDIGVYFLEFGRSGKIFLLGFSSYLLFPLTICSLALLEIDKHISMKSISWLGNITYSSYLIHFPLQLVFVIAVALGLLKQDFYLSPLFLIIFFIILIILSYVIYEKFEMPMQKLIRKKML